MELTGEHRITNSRETVWEALNDPEVLKRCIPGCESLERVSDTELRARIAAAVGPVRARFLSRIRLENLNPPESYTLVGEGKAGAAGFGRGTAEVTLSVAEDSATLLRYAADFKVGGKLAQVGSRLVLGATKKTVDDFFAQICRELDRDAVRAEKEAEIEPAASNWPVTTLKAVVIAVVVLLIWWFLLR